MYLKKNNSIIVKDTYLRWEFIKKSFKKIKHARNHAKEKTKSFKIKNLEKKQVLSFMNFELLRNLSFFVSSMAINLLSEGLYTFSVYSCILQSLSDISTRR